MRFIFAYYPDVLPQSLTSKDIINYINHIIKVYEVGREKCHGFCKTNGKIKRLNAIRAQLNLGSLPPKVQIPVSQRMLEKYGKDITLSPKCNKGKLVWICTSYAKKNPYIFTKNKIGEKENDVRLNIKHPQMKKRSLRKTGFLFNAQQLNKPVMGKGICMSKQHKSPRTSQKIEGTSMHQPSTLQKEATNLLARCRSTNNNQIAPASLFLTGLFDGGFRLLFLMLAAVFSLQMFL